MKQSAKHKPGDLLWYHNFQFEKPIMVLVLEFVSQSKHNEPCYKVLCEEKVGYVLPQFLGKNKNGCGIDGWLFTDKLFTNPRRAPANRKF